MKDLWKRIVEWFKVKSITTDEERLKNEEFTENYRKIDDINFTAIFSNKLANYVVNDSLVLVEGENKRAEYLNDALVPLWKRIKKAVDMAFGLGAVAIIPYTKNGKVYFNIVEQDRVTINEMDGDIITHATILSERLEIQNLSKKTFYIRWTDFKVENGNLLISQIYTNEEGRKIDKPSIWKDITDEQIIHNVDRVPFGFIKCPRNNRSVNDKFGVPITYGAEATIKELKDTLDQINREFEVKKAFVGVDSKMFRNRTLPKSGLYQTLSAENRDGSSFWEVFDPSIRESSYFARLQELYSRLEKEVGTSDGILTERKSMNATATEIKASRYDTFTIVDDMRSQVENGIYNFLKAVDVLANTNGLAPMGEWELNFEWDYGLVESNEDQFQQLVVGLDKGVIAPEELRMFIKPTETIEEAEKRIGAIEERTPSVEMLIGE